MDVICFTRYEPDFSRALIYRILNLPDITDEVNKRKEWLEKTEGDNSLSNEKSEERLLAALCYNKTENVLLALKTSKELMMLEKTRAYLMETMYYLPDAYRDILNELCVKRYTWRYLRVSKYKSDRKIMTLKEEALDALLKMIISDEPEKEVNNEDNEENS